MNGPAVTEGGPPFGLAFELGPEKAGVDVVRTALKHRAQASESARGRLNGRLKRLKVPGFRDASRAMPRQLELPVDDALLDGDDRLAGAVLRCWEDANAPRAHVPLMTHLGKGASFDPKSTIRIGFAWDDESRRVGVGYVGRHQRTT